MKRRTWLWLAAVIVLIAGIGLAWALFADRDADFQAIGPRTRSVRANFAVLDRTIDAADFHDCKNLEEVLNQLSQKMWRDGGEPVEFRFFSSITADMRRLFPDAPAPLMAEIPVAYPPDPNPMTIKQFLRLTFRQATDEDVGFIVHRYGIMATSRKHLNEERTRYVESVPIFDRVKTAWRELMGHVEDDPPEPRLFDLTGPRHKHGSPA
jgi:hypothetical protein